MGSLGILLLFNDGEDDTIVSIVAHCMQFDMHLCVFPFLLCLLGPPFPCLKILSLLALHLRKLKLSVISSLEDAVFPT